MRTYYYYNNNCYYYYHSYCCCCCCCYSPYITVHLNLNPYRIWSVDVNGKGGRVLFLTVSALCLA